MALSGVIAAVATAVDERGEPDCVRSIEHARFLLENGCDALNVLGTTGEATSFSLDQRRRLMAAYRDAGIPADRLMVGTGAAALSDTIALTRWAGDLGYAAALVLPPFYYKGVSDDGLLAFMEALVGATEHRPIPLYLYHFPELSGVPWHLGLISRLIARFGNRIAGLKDSSGELAFARDAAALARDFEVFPSNEATLDEARNGSFAGCISATANVNADLCARAYHRGDGNALEIAVKIRRFFDGKPLIAGVKALLAHIHRDSAWARTMPPLSPFTQAERADAVAVYESARASGAHGGFAAVRARASC